jgi:hypothetical protein
MRGRDSLVPTERAMCDPIAPIKSSLLSLQRLRLGDGKHPIGAIQCQVRCHSFCCYGSTFVTDSERQEGVSATGPNQPTAMVKSVE